VGWLTPTAFVWVHAIWDNAKYNLLAAGRTRGRGGDRSCPLRMWRHSEPQSADICFYALSHVEESAQIGRFPCWWLPDVTASTHSAITSKWGKPERLR
jgi:hypothetical protein